MENRSIDCASRLQKSLALKIRSVSFQDWFLVSLYVRSFPVLSPRAAPIRPAVFIPETHEAVQRRPQTREQLREENFVLSQQLPRSLPLFVYFRADGTVENRREILRRYELP